MRGGKCVRWSDTCQCSAACEACLSLATSRLSSMYIWARRSYNIQKDEDVSKEITMPASWVALQSKYRKRGYKLKTTPGVFGIREHGRWQGGISAINRVPHPVLDIHTVIRKKGTLSNHEQLHKCVVD